MNPDCHMLFRVLSKIRTWIDNRYSRCISSKLKSCGDAFSVRFPIDHYGIENVTVGNGFTCGKMLKLRTFNNWGGGVKFNPRIRIGNNVQIESDCHISAINEVTIGDNVLIASFVYISDHSHGQVLREECDTPPIARPLYSKGPVKIGNNVWIGEKVIILPGVTIGDGAVIGAGSVVTHDVDSYCVAVGNPARVIRQL